MRKSFNPNYKSSQYRHSYLFTAINVFHSYPKRNVSNSLWLVTQSKKKKFFFQKVQIGFTYAGPEPSPYPDAESSVFTSTIEFSRKNIENVKIYSWAVFPLQWYLTNIFFKIKTLLQIHTVCMIFELLGTFMQVHTGYPAGIWLSGYPFCFTGIRLSGRIAGKYVKSFKLKSN